MAIFEAAARAQVRAMAAAIGSDYLAATYTAPGGSPASVQVVVNESTRAPLAGLEQFAVADQAPEAIFLKSEVVPKKDGLLVVGSRSWRIVDLLDDDSHVITVSLREDYS